MICGKAEIVIGQPGKVIIMFEFPVTIAITFLFRKQPHYQRKGTDGFFEELTRSGTSDKQE